VRFALWLSGVLVGLILHSLFPSLFLEIGFAAIFLIIITLVGASIR
jgi:hypothetical protein